MDTLVKDALLKQEPTALAAEITDIVNANLPREKAEAEKQLDATADAVKAGLQPNTVNGLGQPMGSIPMIVYLRWQQEYPGCWQDDAFKQEFLYDNPRCQIPGYKPRPKRMFFQMKHGNMKIGNFGGDLYLDRKAIVQRDVQRLYAIAAANAPVK